MPDANWYSREARRALQRLLPRVAPVTGDDPVFIARAEQYFPTIFRLLYDLYGSHYDFFYWLEQILLSAAQMVADRPADLKALDRQREADPTWFQSEKMLGGVCYVDLFAGDLDGIRSKIPYFRELGLTYLHLMPLFLAPEGDNDGGYAVSDFRRVAPALGTMEQLADLARDFRAEGISLVLDFVFNHTSNEHEWARRALAGDEEFQNYYYMFEDRTLPDQYERTLREIFPEQAPGNFTYQPRIFKWVWTTFHRYQWDLNYSNPAVFNAMLNEMLFLANQGVEVLRLDAVAFIWKQMGTSCENLPQAHWIIRAFNALVKIAAPAMIFKSEAIVHPDAVMSYISPEEAPISYNPTLMALLWEAIATRDVKLLRHSMEKRFALPPGTAWVNYIRSHDDIGWTFADEDAAELWMNGFDHRQFLNRFYTGQFPGSFAKGVPFNFNPVTLDTRICGTAASLVGVEQALDVGNPTLLDHAIARLVLIYGVAISAGGIPLIYLGDEIATLNDYGYRNDPAKADDSRWAHRPRFDWVRAERRHDPTTVEGQVFQWLVYLVSLRQQNEAFGSGNTIFLDTGNTHVLGYICGGQVLALANFTERRQSVDRRALTGRIHLPDAAYDLVSRQDIPLAGEITLEPYRFVWLKIG
ncbi:MAG: amylosucrase [Chloroflexi bacterium]|nr:amylosucrase [Chloroflexota bacterium]